jgi:DNA topoisomerase-2
LTEGDSAKALAVAGVSVGGRDDFGVFPLRGKLLNVREASHTQMLNNKEISALKQIIGLQQGKVYENADKLRYGHVMIMTDQDHDGSHIKGLLINFFQYFWPSLLKVDGFLNEFITPIVKVTRGKSSRSFYTLPEYEHWKEENNNGKGWKIKYYKGLGTSTAKEAKEYFTEIERHKIDFQPLDGEDEKMVNLAFGKNMANARKDWMNAYEEGTYLDQNVDSIKYTDFFNKELILFSRANNFRAIPSMVDGLKPGQRKILFSCFKRKLFKEVKVAQLVGYVSEHSAYHHGEASLAGTIINLAQNFVGSNNINYLFPSGQFGTRALGGKDHASARYIFTKLSPITRAIFPEQDDNVLNFLDDDGLIVEPEWYVPIIPTVLLNGIQGIGTGWSTYIPAYNPRDLVKCMKQLIDNGGVDVENIKPWTNGFIGKMEEANPQRTKYAVEGLIEKVDDTTVLISELPIQKWTTDYKEKVLDKLLEANKIKDYRNNCTDVNICISVTMEPNALLQAEAQGLLNFFKLSGHCNLTNMMCFVPEDMRGHGNIKKFSNVEDIMKQFFVIRLEFYHKRKTFLTNKLLKELNMLEDRVRFILAVIAEEMEIRNRPKVDILNQLCSDGYRMFPKEKKKKK